MPSKVAFDPEEPSLGRIQAVSIAPPHCPTSIKLCISRVEGNPALAWRSDLFADTSSDSPLQEGHISILCTDGPGLSPDKPMAIVQRQPFPDGKYVIKNRAKDIYWHSWNNPTRTILFQVFTKMDIAKSNTFNQVNNHSIYSSVRRLNLFRSGTSHMMRMVLVASP